MKSRVIILTVVILLIPIFVGATPLNLADKVGAGCPFNKGPMLERCNPTIIHANSSCLIPIIYSVSALFPTLTAFAGFQGDTGTAAFPLKALTASPLRC